MGAEKSNKTMLKGAVDAGESRQSKTKEQNCFRSAKTGFRGGKRS
jgi:hypothetical protein